MSFSGNRGRSPGLRILWIPGRRRHNFKGRFDSTNKHVSYSVKQKKNQMWSLGGNKSQRSLMTDDTDSTLLDGPSVSGLASPVTCVIGGAIGVAKCTANESEATLHGHKPLAASSNDATAPHSPQPLVEPQHHYQQEDIARTDTMPIRAASPVPVIITTTTTAEIFDENRFSLLDNNNSSNHIDIANLPIPPKNYYPNDALNTSDGTTASTATTPSPSTSPRSQTDTATSKSSRSKTSKKGEAKNHNNNVQDNVNSIEDAPYNPTIPDGNLDWVDDYVNERTSGSQLNEQKKKKKHTTGKELDQLDGLSSKANKNADVPHEEDEKMIKCLYFTLMCCDCTIS